MSQSPAAHLFCHPHFLIESSQAATASHYEQLPRFQVGQALLYEIAATDGNSEGLYVETSLEPVGHAAPIHLHPSAGTNQNNEGVAVSVETFCIKF